MSVLTGIISFGFFMRRWVINAFVTEINFRFGTVSLLSKTVIYRSCNS